MFKKALRGPKQAPRAWYGRIDEHLTGLYFEKSQSEATLYDKKVNSDIFIISIYVDDLLMTGSSSELISEFKKEMMKVFEMTDLSKMAYFLGIEIKQGEDEAFICEKKYAKEILKKFQMEDCKAVTTPMSHKERLQNEDGAEKTEMKPPTEA